MSSSNRINVFKRKVTYQQAQQESTAGLTEGKRGNVAGVPTLTPAQPSRARAPGAEGPPNFSAVLTAWSQGTGPAVGEQLSTVGTGIDEGVCMCACT